MVNDLAVIYRPGFTGAFKLMTAPPRCRRRTTVAHALRQMSEREKVQTRSALRLDPGTSCRSLDPGEFSFRIPIGARKL